MKKEEKLTPVITGFILYILAAFISVCLLTQLPSLGNGYADNIGFLVSLGHILTGAYGFSSILIPVFLLVAGTLCFLDKWSKQRAACLLVSVIPFFTFVVVERICRRSIVSDTGLIALIKAVSFFLVTLVIVIAEYLITSIIAGKTGNDLTDKAEVKEVISKEENESTIEEESSAEEIKDETPLSKNESFSSKEDDEINKAVDESVNRAIDSNWTLKELLERKKKDNEITEEVPAEPEDVQKTQNETKTANETNDICEPEEKPAESEEEFDVNADPWNVNGKGPKIKFLGKIIKPSRKEVEEEKKVPVSEPETVTVSESTAVDTPVTENETVVVSEPAEVNEPAEEKQVIDEPVIFEKTPEDDVQIPVVEEINTAALDEVFNDISSSKEFVQEEDPAGLVENDYTDEEDDSVEDEYSVEEESVEEESVEEESVEEESADIQEDIPSEEQNENVIEEGEDIFGEDPFSIFDEIDNVQKEETETEKTETLESKPEEKKTELSGTVEERSEQERPHSLISSLDSVFARMDEDAMADVVASERKVNSSNENDSEIKTSVPVTSVSSLISKTNNVSNTAVKTEQAKTVHKKIKRGTYKIPYDLLTEYTENPYWIIDEETNAAAQNLKDTMNEFKIEAEITGIKKGPVVTMFEMLPAPGVKLSKIVALQDNIALRLAASSVRIVAPIPGKRAVGIEVPNAKRAIVSFRECIEQSRPEWKKMSVPVVLGKDIQGETQIMDLVKTPHLLIAGSTGAGKSVCVNSMILSILYKRSPNEVKMILIDPKIVELKLYNDIPHLLTPVITESKKAMQALQYCLCEMERRYALLDGLGVRDISNYNKRIEERKICTEKLPYIVVIIDEFADLMATTGKELESVVARLAAMSRAVGIHLVLATQRPSIDVITGLIKANIPSRIAFMVASKTDSRIIIDQVGADKLLGKGDMLYASATDPFPVRIQGTFISDNEVEAVVESVKEWGEPDYIDDEIFIDDEDEGGDGTLSLFNPGGEDPLYEKALDVVIQAGKASASYIQRRLKIGYNRAARLVEEMEERGIVGPANGSKPREIIHMP